MSTPNIKIKVKTTPAYNANINVGGTNSHYITYEAFQTLIEQELNPKYVTKEDFDAYKDTVSARYITEESFNQRVPKKLTDLEIDLALVKYNQEENYLEVVE